MSTSPFRKVRGVSDQQIGEALLDHRNQIRSLLVWAHQHDYTGIPFTTRSLNTRRLSGWWGWLHTLITLGLLWETLAH